MTYNYGEMFERLGVKGMGHQGAAWCALDPRGVLVLMSHQNFHKLRDGVWVYDAPGDPKLPKVSRSAARSIRLLAHYFAPGKEILLPVAVFETDGKVHADGTHEPAKFKHATGDVYRSRMVVFDPSTGHILCEATERFSV